MQDGVQSSDQRTVEIASVNRVASDTFDPPFDQPVYTVGEAAQILRLSPNQVRAIFQHEPGVHDLANGQGFPRFCRKRRSQLRIPHAVLVRVWNRTEIQGTPGVRERNGKR